MKRAQGLPITTVILAILAIAVLFVLLFIFLKKGGEFGKATTDCVAQGGGCVLDDICRNVDTGMKISGTCPNEDHVCCRALVPQPEGADCASDNGCDSNVCQDNTCVVAS